MFNFFSKICWHATITGSNGEILQSILKSGLLPKEQITANVGNAQTLNKDQVYVSTNAQNALAYLKQANDFSWNAGGLPLLISVKSEKFDHYFSLDSDLHAGYGLEENDPANTLAWFALICAYGSIHNFIEHFPDNISASGKRYKEILKTEIGKELNDDGTIKKEFLLELLEPKTGEHRYLFLEGRRLRKFKEQVSSEFWNRFLQIYSSLPGKGNKGKLGFTKNLSKIGGWPANDIKKIFVISPNGDSNWQKWAKVMPVEHIALWNNWSKLRDSNGELFPGDGKLVQINK